MDITSSAGYGHQKPKVHLIFTSLITEKRRLIHQGTQVIKDRNRPDIVVSMLRSLRKLPIHSADFYLEFDETTTWSENAIMREVMDLQFETKIFHFRLDSFDLWKESSEASGVQESDLLLLFSNDDHVYIENGTEEFRFLMNCLLTFSEQYPDCELYVPLSHYPELHALVPLGKSAGLNQKLSEFMTVPTVTPIGALLLRPRNYISWWDEDFTHSKKFVGPENPFGPSIVRSNAHFLVPRKELFRHLDGYGHVKICKKPFGALKSNFSINKVVGTGLIENTWLVSTTVNETNSNSLLMESGDKGDKQSFLNAIIKANYKRLSVPSILWINTLYNFSLFQVFLIVLESLFTSSVMLISFIRTLLELPLRILLFLISPILRKYHTSIWGVQFKRFLSLSSSHGFSRFFRIFTLEIGRHYLHKRRDKSLS